MSTCLSAATVCVLGLLSVTAWMWAVSCASSHCSMPWTLGQELGLSQPCDGTRPRGDTSAMFVGHGGTWEGPQAAAVPSSPLTGSPSWVVLIRCQHNKSCCAKQLSWQ